LTAAAPRGLFILVNEKGPFVWNPPSPAPPPPFLPPASCPLGAALPPAGQQLSLYTYLRTYLPPAKATHTVSSNPSPTGWQAGTRDTLDIGRVGAPTPSPRLGQIQLPSLLNGQTLGRQTFMSNPYVPSQQDKHASFPSVRPSFLPAFCPLGNGRRCRSSSCLRILYSYAGIPSAILQTCSSHVLEYAPPPHYTILTRTLRNRVLTITFYNFRTTY